MQQLLPKRELVFVLRQLDLGGMTVSDRKIACQGQPDIVRLSGPEPM